MGDTTYTIVPDQAEYIAGEMEGITEKMTATLDQLNASLQANLASWDGPTQTEYLGIQKQWNDAHSQMQSLAKQAAIDLGTINDHYRQGEVAGTQLWS